MSDLAIQQWPLPYVDQLQARPREAVTLVVIHCTELPDLAMAREFGERILYAETGTGNSGHYYIDRDGRIHEFVPVTRIAHHTRGYNPQSVGIELVNTRPLSGLARFAPPADDRAVHGRADRGVARTALAAAIATAEPARDRRARGSGHRRSRRQRRRQRTRSAQARPGPAVSLAASAARHWRSTAARRGAGGARQRTVARPPCSAVSSAPCPEHPR
jgi:hypothetical protein